MAKLNIDVDVNGANKVKDLDKDLQKLEHSSKNLNTTNKKTTSSLAGIGAAAVVTVGSIYLLQKAMSSIIKSGFEYAKQMEDSKAGLSALSLAIQDKNIPLMQRMTTATKEATVVMAELQKINAKTPHTLDQTNQIYKAMYVSMKAVGASSRDIIDLTQKLSVASGAAGIEFNGLLSGVDGLASGTVMANSDLGRFLGSLGLTNAELKNSTDVVGLLNTTLEDFKAIDTITTATSNLTNEWGRLSDSLTKDIFQGTKDGLNEISKLMKNLSDEDVEKMRQSFNGLATGIATAVLGMTKGVVALANGFESLGARIAGATFRIENGVFLNDAQSASLEKMYQTTKDNIAARELWVKTLESGVDVFKSSVTTSQNATKALINQDEAQSILNETTKEYIDTLGQATYAELDKIYADELATYGLDALGDELEGVNKSLNEQTDYFMETAGAATDYADAVNAASDANYGVGTNQVQSYSVVLTPQDQWEIERGMDYNLLEWGIQTSGQVNGYASGGYTGNIGTNQVAGVVHGQEYVVNAQTTKDLGLNNSAGIFQEISAKLDHLYEINLTAKRSLSTQKRTKTLLSAGTA